MGPTNYLQMYIPIIAFGSFTPMVRAAYTHHKTMVVVLKAPLIVFTFYTCSGAFFIRNNRARRARKKIGVILKKI